MPLMNVLSDVKVWVILGIVLALAIGFDNPDAATILMLVLIAQMTVSLDGISFCRRDLKDYDGQILMCVLSCFLVNTGLTLITGLFFIDNTQLWYGWVMLSSVPCAVSVVTASLFMKGDTKLSVLGLTVVYMVAIGLTPLITHLLIGDAVNPLEILRYILMFIAVPFILTVPLKRLHLKRGPKVVFINLMMLLMVFISLGSRRDYIFGEPETILWIIVACSLRIFAFSIILVFLLKRSGVPRDSGIVYLVMGVWKNSGMSISMTMALLGATMPDAVLPCVVSLVMEAAWFAVMSNLIDRLWPPSEGTGASLATT